MSWDVVYYEQKEGYGGGLEEEEVAYPWTMPTYYVVNGLLQLFCWVVAMEAANMAS
jgi:hypothetical protein